MMTRSRTTSMRATTLMAATVLFLSFQALEAQPPATAAESRTRPHVFALASEKFEGRLAGSAGERLAADYITAQLQRIGARPLPGHSGFRLPFEFTAGTRDGGSTIRLNTVGSGGPALNRTFSTRSE